MITPADSYNTFDLGKYYAILQQSNEISQNEYKRYFKSLNLNFDKMRTSTSYNSKDNNSFLNVREIRDLIKKNICKEFEPI